MMKKSSVSAPNRVGMISRLLPPPHHLGGGKRLAIMPLHVFMQEKGIGLAVRSHFPALGQVADDVLVQELLLQSWTIKR
jgi:hypothetical protein